ncbi:MAG: 3'-5' exonuclease [Synergistaceae bacterium]|nr:3'-5' exonuclease [Synergistaceae bacterium]
MAVFDVETNGGAGASVLSASSIVFDESGVMLDVFNRFYFPAERFDPFTARIHGLTAERLAVLRRHAPVYSLYFLEDWPDLMDFWGGWEVDGIAVHNLSFDLSFLPEMAQGAFMWWCSMKGLKQYCALQGRGGDYKYPKLGEAAAIVRDRLAPPPAVMRAEEAIIEGLPHVSLFDCFELYCVMSRLAAHKEKFPTTRFAPATVPFRPRAKEPLSHLPMTLLESAAPCAFTDGVLRCDAVIRGMLAL